MKTFNKIFFAFAGISLFFIPIGDDKWYEIIFRYIFGLGMLWMMYGYAQSVVEKDAKIDRLKAEQAELKRAIAELEEEENLRDTSL